MKRKLLEQLKRVSDSIVFFDEDERKYKYRLAKFDNTSMAKDCIPGTPFRYWESVPQGKRGKASRRKQNNTMDFDPYIDTLFDYPLVVKTVLNSKLKALDELNFHLVAQVPCCGMDCWHCYNDKRVCDAGFLEAALPTKFWKAKEILDKFVECRRSRELPGQKYRILRVSGGEPFLMTGLLAELLELMGDESAQDYEYYPKVLWTETNLVTWAEDDEGNSIVKRACEDAKNKIGLDVEEIFAKSRDRLVIHPCFHGLTDENVRRCTGTSGIGFADLLKGFQRLHEFSAQQPLHLYPTFIGEACDPQGVERLFRGLWKVNDCYPLKVAIIGVDYYPPVRERFERRRTQFECYGRSACLKRWSELLKRHYGLYYGQVLRPLAEAVTSQLPKDCPGSRDVLPEYRPRLIIIKSTGRKEYRQELLTILAGPPNTRIVTTYDSNLVDPVVLDWLRAKFKEDGLDKLNEEGLIVYGEVCPNEDRVSYLPMREVVVRRVEITERLVHIEMTLGNYVVPKGETLKEAERVLLGFKRGLFDYFGRSTLVKLPNIRWVLLGEEALLRKWNGSNELCFHSLGKVNRESFDESELRNGWDQLLDIIKELRDLEELRGRGVFLQVVPDDENSPAVRSLKEGDMIGFQLRYYIPDFGVYDDDDLLKPARTLRIRSTQRPVGVQGYQRRPLPKYGALDFDVICNEAEDGTRGQLIIESENQSCYCPRLQLEFSLKKANASGG